MGNRAVIAYVPWKKDVPQTYSDAVNLPGVYLHNNGGRESIDAFLRVAKDYRISADDYGLARLVQIIANYLGGVYSIGVGPLSHLDTHNYDNGTWVVHNWAVVDHWFSPDIAPYDTTYHSELYDTVREANDRVFLGEHAK